MRNLREVRTTTRKTQKTTVICILLTYTFCADILYWCPMPVLGTLIVWGALSVMDISYYLKLCDDCFKRMNHLGTKRGSEGCYQNFAIWSCAFFGALLIDVVKGVSVGCLMVCVFALWNMAFGCCGPDVEAENREQRIAQFELEGKKEMMNRKEDLAHLM